MEWWAVRLPWINAQAETVETALRRWWDGKMGKDLEKVEETAGICLFFFRKKKGVIIAATCGSYYCNIGNHLVFQEFTGWWSITRSTKFIVLGWVVSVFCVWWMSWDWASTHFACFSILSLRRSITHFHQLELETLEKAAGPTQLLLP